MRRVVYEIQTGVREKPWWQTCSHVEFREKVTVLDSPGRLALLQDIKASLLMTRNAVADPRDEDHLRRARSAMILLSEKERILTGVMYASKEGVPGRKSEAERLELQRQERANRARNEVIQKTRADCLNKSRQSLERGDLREALNFVLVMMESEQARLAADKQKKEALRQKTLEEQKEEKISREEEQRRHYFQWKNGLVQTARAHLANDAFADSLSTILQLLEGFPGHKESS